MSKRHNKLCTGSESVANAAGKLVFVQLELDLYGRSDQAKEVAKGRTQPASATIVQFPPSKCQVVQHELSKGEALRRLLTYASQLPGSLIHSK
jgi:hypothetical protein